MNNEIKEILDNLDFSVNHTKCWVEPLGLNQDTWKILLDYITNLQQENHELKSKLECYENGVYYSSEVDKLQQENERLKEEKDNLYLDNTMLKMEKDIYKQGYEDFKNLLNILQNGSDKNV